MIFFNSLLKQIDAYKVEQEVKYHCHGIYRHFQKKTELKPAYEKEAKDIHTKYSHLLQEDWVSDRTKGMILSNYILHALLIPDYKLCIKRCDEALSFYKSNKLKNRIFERNFLNRKIDSLLQTKNYSLAIESLKKQPVPLNILSRMRYYALNIQILLKNQDYDIAADIYFKHATRYNLSKISTALSYNYRILKYNLFVILHLTDSKSKHLPSNRTLKLALRDSGQEVLDKGGITLFVFIFKLLINVMMKSSTDIIIMENSIQNFLNRYTTNNLNYRAKYFIKMLLEVDKSHYYVPKIKLKTKWMLAKLKKKDPSSVNQPVELEFIQYETLWDLLLRYFEAGKSLSK